jgi:glucose-6-phosphate dehydrogenase assembly protein OpcA
MATSYKTLGQVDLTTTGLTDLVTVSAGKEVIISTIVIANRTATADSFRIAIRTDGDAIANKHYVAYDVAVAANDSTTLTLGISMVATDVLSVKATTADVLSINVFGAEITL